MQFTENIFPFLQNELQQNRQVALVTLVNVEGSSPRPVGSFLGVSETGQHIGMVTGGCAERAVAAEAVACIEANTNRLVRYGEGSPYFDVKLPCGSGIDLYFEAQTADSIATAVGQALDGRVPITYQIDTEKLSSRLVDSGAPTSQSDDCFSKVIEPDFTLHCFGEGVNLVSLCQTANVAGLDVRAYTPDADTKGFLDDQAIRCEMIHRRHAFQDIPLDRYSGVVTVFHDHDWETPILHAALNSEARYIGALGSRKTHALRLEQLARMPETTQPPSSIHGPVGLTIGAKNPSEIAISIVAEITSVRRKSNA